MTDTTLHDFSAGTLNSCVADANIGDGAVRLGAAVDEAFSGTGLPTGWSSTPWTGGTSTVSGGQITVDGALAAPGAYFSPGRTLEFVATFGNQTFENIGFGQMLATAAEYWAMFGIGNTADGLYVRTNLNNSETNTLISGSWLGASHLYRSYGILARYCSTLTTVWCIQLALIFRKACAL